MKWEIKDPSYITLMSCLLLDINGTTLGCNQRCNGLLYSKYLMNRFQEFMIFATQFVTLA